MISDIHKYALGTRKKNMTLVRSMMCVRRRHARYVYARTLRLLRICTTSRTYMDGLISQLIIRTYELKHIFAAASSVV